MKASAITSVLLAAMAPITHAQQSVGYRNFAYADCQDGGPSRIAYRGACQLAHESTHAIRINAISPDCTGKSYCLPGKNLDRTVFLTLFTRSPRF